MSFPPFDQSNSTFKNDGGLDPNQIFNFNPKLSNANSFSSQIPFDFNFLQTNQTSNHFSFKPSQNKQQDDSPDNFHEAFQDRPQFYQNNYNVPPGMGIQNQFLIPEKKIEEYQRPDQGFERKLLERLRQSEPFDPKPFAAQIMNQTPYQPIKASVQYTSASPMIQPVSRPIGQIKQPFSPQTLPKMFNQNKGMPKDKNNKRGSIPAQKVEEIMSTIENYKINPISLLNEISTKIKKRVDYHMTESPYGKIRVFECICKLDKEILGTGKGNSKQAAKTEAAKEGVRTLLSKESYMPERAAIILSVQKSSGQVVPGTGLGSNYGNPSPLDSPGLSAITNSEFNPNGIRQLASEFKNGMVSSPNISHVSNDSDSHMNDSPLYELNVIAKECFIEPQWVVTQIPNQNGDFEAELKFEKLVAHGKGRKKQDCLVNQAKREAAASIIMQIRANPQLKERFNPKSSTSRDYMARLAGKLPVRSNLANEATKDKKKKVFENSIESKFFDELSTKDPFSKESLTQLNSDIEEHITGLIEKYGLDIMARDYNQETFKKILDYTSMAVANPRQIMMDSEKHLADLVTDCHLVPVGSFALESLRNDKAVLDAIITFREKSTQLTTLDFLELLKASLEVCVNCEKESNMLTIEFDFKIVQRKDLSDPYLEIISDKNKACSIKLLIFVANITKLDREKSLRLFQNKYDYSIVHLKRIYDLFEDSPDELREFRTVLTALRIWRDRSDFQFLRTELLDIILLNEFLNSSSVNIASCILNTITILNHEETTKTILSRFDKYYITLYEVYKANNYSISGTNTRAEVKGFDHCRKNTSTLDK